MFTVVVLHECGHWVAARYFGWHIIEIRLLPFGGELIVAHQRLSGAGAEIMVALAGPLVNICLIVVAVLLRTIGILSADSSAYFIQANIIIGLFNLLPIMPLDGGKILLAISGMVFSYKRAQMFTIHFSLLASVVLLLASVSATNLSGIRFDLLIVSMFLLYVNIHMLRKLPILFIQFLLQKYAILIDTSNVVPHRLFCKPVKISVVASHLPTVAVLGNVMRGCRHRFLLTNKSGQVVSIVEEKQLLARFFSSDS